jgi:hypothetical protein
MGLMKGSRRPFAPIARGAGFFSATTAGSGGFGAAALTNGATGLATGFLADFVETAFLVETAFF